MKLRIDMGIRGSGNGGGGGDAWAWRRAKLDVRSRVRFSFLVLGTLRFRLWGFIDRRTRFLLGDGRRRRDIRKAFYRWRRRRFCYGGTRKGLEEAQGVKKQEEKREASPYYKERQQDDTTERATGHAERLFPDGRRCLGCLGRRLCRSPRAA